MFTGNPVFDALSGLFIGMMLLFASIFLAREFYSLIIGESVSKADLEKIKDAFKRNEVKKVIDIKTVHLGPTEVMIAAKIDIIDAYEGVSYDVVNDIERVIRRALPDKKAYIYIETDEFDPEYD
ncbi:MAG: cation transporter, partial [Enterococcus sp.]